MSERQALFDAVSTEIAKLPAVRLLRALFAATSELVEANVREVFAILLLADYFVDLRNKMRLLGFGQGSSSRDRVSSSATSRRAPNAGSARSPSSTDSAPLSTDG